MKHNPPFLVLRWSGRVLGLLCVGFILLFVVGERLQPWRLDAREWALFIFFPWGVCIGVIVGWWREALGGAVTLVSLAMFYLVHYFQSGRWPGGPWFLIFAVPAVFFLAARAARRRPERCAALPGART